jgi:hypothetical protein
MVFDPFRLSIALVPLAAYLVLLGFVNLRRRPFLTAGGSDLAALGIALSGLVLIGPLELTRPEAATAEFGNFIWLVLLSFYWLSLLLIVLVSRPRLVVYNVSAEELHPVVAEAASRLDADSRWAGNSLNMPNVGIQLHLEAFEWMRNVSLVSSGGRQNLEAWRRLARELAATLKPVRVKANPRGIGLLLLGVLLMTGCLANMVGHPQELASAVRQVFAY